MERLNGDAGESVRDGDNHVGAKGYDQLRRKWAVLCLMGSTIVGGDVPSEKYIGVMRLIAPEDDEPELTMLGEVVVAKAREVPLLGVDPFTGALTVEYDLRFEAPKSEQ